MHLQLARPHAHLAPLVRVRARVRIRARVRVNPNPNPNPNPNQEEKAVAQAVERVKQELRVELEEQLGTERMQLRAEARRTIAEHEEALAESTKADKAEIRRLREQLAEAKSAAQDAQPKP